MKKYLVALLLCEAVFLYSDISRAEDYSECRARCTQDQTDCMNEPQASEPEVQLAKEAACSQKAQSCYSECDNLKPLDNEIAPESNPNIIRK
jgi:hypothetical protein